MKILGALLIPFIAAQAFAQVRTAPCSGYAARPLAGGSMVGVPVTAVNQAMTPDMSRFMDLTKPIRFQEGDPYGPESMDAGSAAEAPANSPFEALRDFKKLDAMERAAFESGVDRAFDAAMDADRDVAERREAVVFMGRAGILSLHDLEANRFVMDRLNKVRFTLGPVRASGMEAVQAVYDHQFRPVPKDLREGMRQKLDEAYPKF